MANQHGQHHSSRILCRPFSSCSEKKGSGLVQVLQVLAQVPVPGPCRTSTSTSTSTSPVPAGRFASAFQHVLFGKPGSGDGQTTFSSSALFFPFALGSSALIPAPLQIATVLRQCLVTSLDALTTSSHFNLRRVHGRGLTWAGLFFVALSPFACLIQKSRRRCFR